ncbi:hypothetical protein PVAP13_2KG251000 [Panicum virgatum]|uniref:Uncharacterized protein n=1 Tax=Panicum virgatum TaxID=38727 RepID=A0A8T0W4A6_PANVG|nr:hypothetical protein PVAP13_2KG251000 [Panicum virgatum]KAG2641427.1 hypothetical protein PVAP13_2KG251000 [Panicum virgatum]
MDRRRPLTDVSNSAPDVSLAPTKRKRTGEDGLENIDPNERNRQSRRERNAAMTEEDKEKRRAKDRERHAGSPCVTGPTSVGTKKTAASKYADLPEEEKEKRRAKAREYYYRKKYLVEPDPILPPNASVGNSTQSTIAGPATCHTEITPEDRIRNMDMERYSRLSAEKRHAKITNSLQNRQMRNMNKQGDPLITPVVHPSLQSTVTQVKTRSHCMGSSNDIAGFQRYSMVFKMK